MKQLRNFSAQNAGKSNGGAADTGPQTLMDEALKKYGGMDENALLNQLLKNVHTQRADGTYDETQLLGFANTVSPFLDESQRKKLENIITMISAKNG